MSSTDSSIQNVAIVRSYLTYQLQAGIRSALLDLKLEEVKRELQANFPHDREVDLDAIYNSVWQRLEEKTTLLIHNLNCKSH